jgi:MscS family membrane protein
MTLSSRRAHILFSAFFFCASGALGQDSETPLQPPDRSSPRAALMTFLNSTDAVAAHLAQDYLPSPSRATFNRFVALTDVAVESLDLNGIPPASRRKAGAGAALALYEVLNRIALPPWAEIPDATQMGLLEGPAATRWVVPNTEIALVRAEDGARSGEYLFSADSVARADEFYARVRGLAHRRTVPLQNMEEIVATGGGWMVPYSWTQALPSFLRTPLAGQSSWKWIGLALVLGATAGFLRLAFRLSRLGSSEHPFRRALALFTMPAFVLLAALGVTYLALFQLNLVRGVGAVVQLAANVLIVVTLAWLLWSLVQLLAEAIITSPRIAPESIDAHLIRIAARLLGIVGAVTLLAVGADRLGMPVYGIVAGLGVGGLAVALAARPTVENLIGGLSLFADKPIRVGDLCKYGDAIGTVEAIGMRSTRIRGRDRAVTTIPNAVLATMPIENLTQRDRILIKGVISLRYETSPEQLREVLGKVRDMLLADPRIDPDPASVRFVELARSSLDIQLFAYVMTRDWWEFLGIREEILVRVMEIVQGAGTALAFPSQTLYLGRDAVADGTDIRAPEGRVREWWHTGAQAARADATD